MNTWGTHFCQHADPHAGTLSSFPLYTAEPILTECWMRAARNACSSCPGAKRRERQRDREAERDSESERERERDGETETQGASSLACRTKLRAFSQQTGVPHGGAPSSLVKDRGRHRQTETHRDRHTDRQRQRRGSRYASVDSGPLDEHCLASCCRGLRYDRVKVAAAVHFLIRSRRS